MKKILLSLLLVIGGLVSLARAEATKEFLRDSDSNNNGSLYSGVNPGTEPMNIFQWSFSAINVDVNSTADPNPPEGIKVAQTHVTLRYGGWGIFNVDAPGSNTSVARDYSDYAGGDLRFWLKSTTALVARIEYISTDGTDRQIPINEKSTGGVWAERIIPLVSLPADFNIKKVVSPFIIAQEANPNGATDWEVDHVRWTKPLRSVNPLVIFPISPAVKPNGNREITVEGRDANDEQVLIYSTFSFLYSGDGSIAPTGTAPGLQSGVLTVGSMNGGVVGNVIKETNQDGLPIDVQQVFTPYTVDSSVANKQYGLLSETYGGIQLGSNNPSQNGDMALYSENSNNTATLPTVSDDIANPPEGAKTTKTVLQIKTVNTQYQGWAIQWGRTANSTENSDSYTLDMSQYYDGSIRFWFKAPASAALANGLMVGIRSGNVPAGREISKVLLSKYVPFDNQWHAVALPMTLFAKGRPFADIARTKVLFNISLAGAIGGSADSRTFYIDNLRWDTQLPAALARIDVEPNSKLSPVKIPLGFKRLFTATGYDANGTEVDISPTWDFGGGASLGTLSNSAGPSTLLTASASPVSGQIRASVGGVSGTTSIDVAPVTFTGFYNVYSDLGVGGQIGVAAAPYIPPAGSTLTLHENTGGVPSDPARYMDAKFTLGNTPGKNDAFAVWFVQEPSFPRYMGGFEHGYLDFFVRSTHDLEISIRSANVPSEDTKTEQGNKAKVLLSEFGVPHDGSWQEVVIPLDYFTLKEPRLDFTQVQTYFAIGATSVEIGEVADQTFDVDNVRWLSTSQLVPSADAVYKGLQDKQPASGSGLVRSYDGDPTPHAFTYDQAISAMAFTYRRDTARAKRIFDVYNSKFNSGAFDGFANDYNVDNPNIIIDGQRTTGPNAWMLLALVHYKNVSGDNSYSAMMTGIANWLLKLQDTDGGLYFGKSANGTLLTNKSTEQNFDAYRAFDAYGWSAAQAPFIGYAMHVNIWLRNAPAWNASERRFNLGTTLSGQTNTDKALDVYSWAPLALSSFTSVVDLASATFANTQTNAMNGARISGFDFSGYGYQAPVDKDAVWLEGTAQMVLAYRAAGRYTDAEYLLNQLKQAIVQTNTTGSQGLPYSTTIRGTAYSFYMTATYPSASSDAWFIFASDNFNPFQGFPLIKFEARNISNNQLAKPGLVAWTGITPGTSWTRADQYVYLDAQPIALGSWGIRIYTDNTSLYASPQFNDPTPCQLINGIPDVRTCNNPDSDPSGLLLVPATGNSSTDRLPLAWSIKDTTAAVDSPLPSNPNTGPQTGQDNRYQWFYTLDRATPAIDRNNDGKIVIPPPNTAYSPTNDTAGFSSDQYDPFVTVETDAGIHGDQDPTHFFTAPTPNYLYFESDFTNAGAQATYRTNRITLEFFFQ